MQIVPCPVCLGMSGRKGSSSRISSSGSSKTSSSRSSSRISSQQQQPAAEAAASSRRSSQPAAAAAASSSSSSSSAPCFFSSSSVVTPPSLPSLSGLFHVLNRHLISGLLVCGVHFECSLKKGVPRDIPVPRSWDTLVFKCTY